MPPKRALLRPLPRPATEAAAAICAVVRRIPKGWVAFYGQVAAMAGLPRRARLVGTILQDLDPTIRIPWHRWSLLRARCPTACLVMAGTQCKGVCLRKK